MPSKTFTAYLLHFQTPLHIGDSRPEDYGHTEPFIHSDTLHAAIIASWAKLGGEIPEDGNPGLHLSSLFPFCTVNDEVKYFFPKLFRSFNISIKSDGMNYAKKLKKLKWLDQHYFECQLNDWPIESFGNDNQSDLQGEFASKTLLGEFVKTQISQRVVIPRDRSEGDNPTPFYMERIFFRQGAGLYFLFEGAPDAAKRLEQALSLLQYEGLGTDRTVGNGLFEYKVASVTLKLPEESSYRTNIGLFCPKEQIELEHMLDEKASYDFLKRGGWITTAPYQTLRKRTIFMFREGSIFRTDQAVAGRPAIDVSPDDFDIGHKVWRNGSSIFLPVKT